MPLFSLVASSTWCTFSIWNRLGKSSLGRYGIKSNSTKLVPSFSKQDRTTFSACASEMSLTILLTLAIATFLRRVRSLSATLPRNAPTRAAQVSGRIRRSCWKSLMRQRKKRSSANLDSRSRPRRQRGADAGVPGGTSRRATQRQRRYTLEGELASIL